jgi:Peptidase family M23/Putative serine esterase (DUF676)
MSRHRLLWPLPVVLAAALSVAPAPPAGAGGPNAGGWVRPVDGEVVEPFDEPASAYGAGHRGADLAAEPGTTVRAANAGVVTFAGVVAGSRHVVVLHDGGLRTSYSFLLTIAVRTGQRVDAGQAVGTSGDTGPGHGIDVLHFGLRIDDRYLDPMSLFEPVDLTEIVRLVPADAPSSTPFGTTSGGEATELALALDLPAIEVPEWARDLGIGAPGPEDDGGGGGGGIFGSAVDAASGAAEWVADQAGTAVDVGSAAVGVLADQALGLAAVSAGVGEELLARLTDVGQTALDAWEATPTAAFIRDLVEAGARFREWQQAECSNDAPPADGTGGSGHLLMAVAGINTETASNGSTNSLDVAALDYHDDESFYFSYAPSGGAYTVADTWGDLLAAGRRLGEQLRELDARHPGREVDLIAHSQGGIVVDVFLKYVYDAADSRYPPIGTIVTLSSPHEGAPLATAAAQIRASRSGRRVTDLAASVFGLPPGQAVSPQQLSEGSAFLAALEARPLPDHLDYTTIGVATDAVVPATNVSVDGATEGVVHVDGFSVHSAALTDPAALRAVRAGLEGRAPPCVGLGDALRGSLAPVLIRRAEHVAGDAGEVAGRATDLVTP